MHNFKNDIIKALGDEMSTFEYIRIESGKDGYDWGEKDEFTQYIGKLLDWKTASKLLDYEYDTGFGGQECNNITVWTKNKIYFIHEYDGATNIDSIDRNPLEK